LENKTFKLPAIPYRLKWVFALIPIIWIFRTIDMRDMYHAALALPWWGVPLVVSTVLVSMFLQGVRWWMLLRTFIPHIGFSKVMGSHFAGIFYSIALPTSAAGDFVRTMLIAKDNDYSVAWGATWISRIVGLLALLLFSVLGLILIDKSSLPQAVIVSILTVFLLLALCFFLSFSKKVTRPVRAFLRKIVPLIKVMEVMENIRNGIYQYRFKKRTLLNVFLITVLVQLLLVGYACLIIKGLSGKFCTLECLTFIPMIEIVCVSVPLTPSGIGVRELLLALMFNHMGLSKEQLGVYIMLGFLATGLKLVGGVPILLGLVKPPKASSHEH
jgi:glycosyltransferase 2 family protein